MSKTRREFLRSCAVLCAAGAASQLEQFGAMTAHAQGAPEYRALVCLLLAGGNDSNNMIVPVDSRYAAYAAMRGPVALGANSLLPAGGSGLALHPALTSIQRLYQQNAVALTLNVGTLVQPTTKATLSSVELPRSLQSHLDQIRQWQTSDPTGGETGWGGRINDVMSASNPGTLAPGVAVSSGSSLFLSGGRTNPLNVSPDTMSGLLRVGTVAGMATRVDSLQRLLTFDTGLKLVSAANGVLDDALGRIRDVNAALAGAPALPVTFPTTSLGRQLSQVAKLMSVRGALGMNRQIFFVTVGGFDNHEALLSNHNQLMVGLDQAVSAFFRTLDSFGLTKQVTLFTESEFNRTADANASLGTDHGWGGHHLVIGGAVRGGNIYGTMPTLEINGPSDMGNRGVWIPTTSLDQYAATLAGWFGVSDPDLDAVFPNLRNFQSRQLSFLPVLTFSDEPVVARGTAVRSIHFTELRSAIDSLRARYGLEAVKWTDAPLVPGVTTIKRVHLTELRAALDDVYVRAGRTPPAWADTSFTLIRADHIAELRAAVLAIW